MKGGGPTVTALTAQGMTIMRLFVVQVLVGTTHGEFCHNPTPEIPVNIFEPLLPVGTLW